MCAGLKLLEECLHVKTPYVWDAYRLAYSYHLSSRLHHCMQRLIYRIAGHGWLDKFDATIVEIRYVYTIQIVLS
jgi:hypothetical protein